MPHKTGNSTFVVKAGYLMRDAKIHEGSLYLTGDVNTTTTIEVIAAPSEFGTIYFNDEPLTTNLINSRHLGKVEYNPPALSLPNFS